ncbi:MAG: roadblock/LC7 domain-containing protein [Chloroherpetonaceae bacterium]|nr:roadblock/LC7 domain-containing protein [Chloroherpetonaceae bacterium]MCS7211433.1 roadblock/LC7 domain-containing protein [Chloroherpetonaceae bacterium]MDW8020440.1 roadblock/LC7 domain-containing protein [Chloroherpetonaceae bacterium]MDW8466238.1 roadblock/LC7 domain-containing protein [Chloroherpetonaceae bacterium]
MRNFSEALSLFSDLPSVEGVLIADSDGLTLASSFKSKDAHIALSPIFHSLLDSVFQKLNEIGETANQIFIVQDARLIVVIPIYDVFLLAFSEKKNLDMLQSKLQEAVKIVMSIVKPELQNT